jgi:hypothetical protein
LVSLIKIKTLFYFLLIGFVGYRLVNSLLSKKKNKEEKARLRQQKKLERQASPQPSPRRNKQK